MVKRTPAYKNKLKALELERTGGVTNRKKSNKQTNKYDFVQISTCFYFKIKNEVHTTPEGEHAGQSIWCLALYNMPHIFMFICIRKSSPHFSPICRDHVHLIVILIDAIYA